MIKGGCIYIITNKNKTTLYIGVTTDLVRRISEHKNRIYKMSFSLKYNLNQLLYYESFLTIAEAILREKEIKKWSRSKKEGLINTKNPKWLDLWEEQVKFW